MAYTTPTIADFKARFTRDFQYGATEDTVMDPDITNALADAGINFNSSLWNDQAQYSLAFLYLTAHYLVMNLREGAAGVSGKGSWLETSKAVGSVSLGFTVPQSIQDNPLFALLSKTTYGIKYLALVIPRIIGNVFVVDGATLP